MTSFLFLIHTSQGVDVLCLLMDRQWMSIIWVLFPFGCSECLCAGYDVDVDL